MLGIFGISDMSRKLLVVIVLLAIITYCYWYYSRSKSLLQHWVSANGFKLLHVKRGSPIAPLAMYFTTTRNQVLFHVAVYDPSLHRIRSAWIRFGSRWLGLLDTDAIDVEWEHEP